MSFALPQKSDGSSILPWSSWALLAGVGVFALHPLTPTWDNNPNYSFGWLIPLVAAFLFFERWPTRPARETSRSITWAPLSLLLVVGGLFFLAFRLAAEADPDWRPGLWIIVGFYVAVLLGWLWIYGGWAWLRHFAFPVCFLFLSLPWFFQIEYPLVQGLMRWNAVVVSKTLEALAISATPGGNIIQLQNCQLGVEEACSGILSLQASLMMGCLLGEIYHLTVRRRFLLIFISMLLALVGNYLRTFFLAMIAFYNDPSAVTRWHDTAGYAILIFTGVGSWLAALSLGSLQALPAQIPSAPVGQRGGDKPVQTQNALRLAITVFAIGLVVEIGTQAWFSWREAKMTRHPEWTAQLPATDSFKEVTLPDLTLQALRSDVFKGGQWQDERGWNWNVYWLKYDPKPYTRIVLGWHNPDNCLPSIGLTKDRDYPNFTASVNGISFYVHPKKFLAKTVPVYLFWVVYPNSGDLPPEEDTRIEQPLDTKFRSHLQDVWNGYRGVGVETMEVAITGPKTYEDAQAAYLERLKTMVVPNLASTVGASH